MLRTATVLAADPVPSGKFLFDGSSHIGVATLTNAANRDGGLFLNGEYYSHLTNNYTAIFRPVRFDYQRFTVATKLRPEWIGKSRQALLVGGKAHRWLALCATQKGLLEISLNNFAFRQEIENVNIANDEWLTLALSFDLQKQKSVIYTNGTRAAEVVLPPGLGLKVRTDTVWSEHDKVWTFTDYSSGIAFRGLIAGLLVFDTVLSDYEVQNLFGKQ